MQIPPILGNFTAGHRYIFAAADEKYFENFGKILINSVKRNTSWALHLHIFNPTIDQINYCYKNSVSLTYEAIPFSDFQRSAERWRTEPTDPVEKLRYARIQTSMQKGNDANLQERLQKTYFASARFLRLSEIIKPEHCCFAIDIDAVVRKEIPALPNDKDCYFHRIYGKKARVLAGGAYFPGGENGVRFVKSYSDSIKRSIVDDYIYWSLDQDLLDTVVPAFSVGELPKSLIDWDMGIDSAVWTAKGLRKDSPEFIAEQQKYIS
jgi:hypothetical protein